MTFLKDDVIRLKLLSPSNIFTQLLNIKIFLMKFYMRKRKKSYIARYSTILCLKNKFGFFIKNSSYK